jgi:hypothetical protein
VTPDQLREAAEKLANSLGIAVYILDGKVQVLLMTSRDTGRWIVPEGNINAGATPAKAAEIALCSMHAIANDICRRVHRCAVMRPTAMGGMVFLRRWQEQRWFRAFGIVRLPGRAALTHEGRDRSAAP